MYASVEIATPAAEGAVLAIPASSVIDSGARQVVLIDRGEGRFEPRTVRLGAQGGDWVEVVEGVKAGEKVVTSANFLIDAESNLRTALQGFTGTAGKRSASNDRGTSMIGRLIGFSARNQLLVLLATLMLTGFGVWSLVNTPLDALPDLSDTQVIVYTEYPGQAPQVVEDQVTYPLATALLAVPHAKVVRGFSNFAVSFVYVVFEDGTDLYWARSRVLEYLNFAAKRLPEGVTPTLGPDASGVGWVYEYVVLGAQRTLAELRSIQDWLVRYQLITAKGVAEVASVGGFERQYQVVVDPQKLQAFGIPLDRISDAIRASNQDVGGRTIEMSETEYMIRGRGYLRGLDDLGTIVLKASASGTPVLLRDVARIQLGPDERRGIAEMDGTGEVVGGIALKRDGADALTTIGNIKEKLEQLKPGLPEGVQIAAGL